MGTKYTFNIDVDFIQQVCKNSVKSTLGVGQCTIGLGAVLSPAIVRHESADQAFGTVVYGSDCIMYANKQRDHLAVIAGK